MRDTAHRWEPHPHGSAATSTIASAHAGPSGGGSCIIQDHVTPRAPTIRSLADLAPETLAVMHGSSVTGDCSGALLGLADDYERRLLTATAA